MSKLRKKTLDGLVWTFSQQFGLQLINFFVSIILARLLLPEEFGLIGMIAIFIAIGNSLVDGGMSSSLIRTENPDNIDYSTVFFTNLAISIFAYLLVFFLAPFIAIFFDQIILKALLQVYCLTFIIRAFSTIQSTKLNKEMNFKPQFLINVPSLIAGSILGIFLAYKGFGVWSLIWMNLAQSLIATIQLWFYSEWTPSFIFDKERLKVHLNFGYKLTISGILNGIIKNIYNIIIGKFFSAAQLGFFTRAKSMQELPVINVSNALKKVTYPLFSSIINDDQRLKSVFKNLMQQVLFIIMPLLIIGIIIAEPLFRFLLTEKWLPAVPYFQILCVAGIIMPLNSYNLNILLVKGQSGQVLKLEFFKNSMILFGALFAIPFGIYGLLWSFVGSTFITFFLNAFASGKLINFPIKEQLKEILPILGIGIFCGLICFYGDSIIVEFINNDILRIFIVIIIFLFIYLLLSSLLKISAFNQIQMLVFKKTVK